MRDKLLNNITLLVNEIDLTMELGDVLIADLKTQVNEIKSDESIFTAFVEKTYTDLKVYEIQISTIVLSKQKIKTDYYNFLNEIILLNNLDFSLFKDESKNTKKGLINYLYNIYMSCAFLYLKNNKLEENFSEELNNFISNIKIESESKLKEIEKPRSKLNANSSTPSQLSQQPQQPPQLLLPQRLLRCRRLPRGHSRLGLQCQPRGPLGARAERRDPQ